MSNTYFVSDCRSYRILNNYCCVAILLGSHWVFRMSSRSSKRARAKTARALEAEEQSEDSPLSQSGRRSGKSSARVSRDGTPSRSTPASSRGASPAPVRYHHHQYSNLFHLLKHASKYHCQVWGAGQWVDTSSRSNTQPYRDWAWQWIFPNEALK